MQQAPHSRRTDLQLCRLPLRVRALLVDAGDIVEVVFEERVVVAFWPRCVCALEEDALERGRGAYCGFPGVADALDEEETVYGKVGQDLFEELGGAEDLYGCHVFVYT